MERVARKITPNDREREKMVRLSEALRGDIVAILEKSGIDATVSLQGSFARDTWLRGEADLDIFAQFSPQMERGEWTDRVLPEIRKGLSRYRMVERYAEHPFLEFHVGEIRVNVVPCYAVKRGEWKSATDRTPYHTEYMKNNLTSELRPEARLLKKFVKGIGTYGAEIRVGGFSGMLIDTLILYYRSFLEALKQASLWTSGVVLDVNTRKSTSGETEKGFNADLVAIDPVDPNRNLAAALRRQRLWNFVAAGREFLRRPGLWYFFPGEFGRKTKAQFERQIALSGHDLVVVVFEHRYIVPDILWGQLLKLERSLSSLIARKEFQVRRSEVWSDEERNSAVFLEVDGVVLSRAQTHRGPPLAKHQDSQSFLDRHLGASDTARGPWVEENRWVVEKKRKIRSIDLIVKASLRDHTYGLALPGRAEGPSGGKIRVLKDSEVLSLMGKEGFDKALWEFLEAKPSWLKEDRS